MNQVRGREVPRLEAVKGQKEAEIKKLQTELKRVCVCPKLHAMLAPPCIVLMYVDLYYMYIRPSQVEEKLSGFRSSLDQVRELQPRVMRTSQLNRDLEELDAKIGSEESKLGGGDSSRSHLLVNRELQEAQMKA